MNRKSKKRRAAEELRCHHMDQAYDLPWIFIFRLIPFHDCRAARKGIKMQRNRKSSFCRPGKYNKMQLPIRSKSILEK